MATLSKTDDGIALQPTPALKRLHRNLHDLIVICVEGCTKVQANSLVLTGLQYVSDEKYGGAYSMHFVALVREHDQSGTTPIRVTFTVSGE